MPHITNELYFNRVPWDYAYANVVNFGSNANFGAYIIANCDSTLTILNSTEIRDNKIKVPYNKSRLEGRNINYLTYRNTDHSNRYYGCFITDMHYISEDVTELTFTYDVWNCFYYNATLGQCYVEREHINRAQDTIGSNTLAEPVATGNKQLYWRGGSEYMADFNDQVAEFYTTVSQSPDPTTGKYERPLVSIDKGVVNVLEHTSWNLDIGAQGGIGELSIAIDRMANDDQQESFLAVYTIPRKCSTESSDTFKISTGDYIYSSYTPRNKKLYTKQFCSCLLDNSRGDIQELFFEKMGTDTDGNKACACQVEYFAVPTPAIFYYLQGYEGISRNYMRSGSITDFPQTMFTIDSYTEYMATNRNRINADVISSVIGGILKPTITAVGSGGKSVGKALESTTNTIESFYKMESSLLDVANDPPIPKGQNSAIQFNNYTNNNKIRAYAFALDVESAKQVDDYLSIYGYQTNRVKIPNMNNRNIFNYVKTQNAEITGVTSSLSKQLSDIFNNGVFIWHNVSQVGNFDIEHNG